MFHNPFRGVVLKKEVAIGDLLTTTSILISLIALLFSWSQSRDLVQREQANKVRDAAAKTLAKLQRWQTISLALFDEIQPSLVETSELLANSREAKKVYEARDFLYKKIRASDQHVRQTLRDEEIESAYVYLYGYNTKYRDTFRRAFTSLESQQDMMLSDLLERTEADVLAYVRNPQLRSNTYYTATLGNALRASASKVEERYRERILHQIAPVERELSNLVGKSDNEILRKN
jgi:hypothetical protein